MICANCGDLFEKRVVIDGKSRNLSHRKFCFKCSPWGKHNTRRRLCSLIDPEAFSSAVTSSDSVAQVLRKLGRAAVGSNYKWVHKTVKDLNLDTSHFTGKAHGRTRSPFALKPEDVLIENGKATTGAVKKMVRRLKLIPYFCSECNSKPKWKGKPLVLRMDHINGKRNDHRTDNLRFLCPNCDSQTITYCGRNNLRKKQQQGIILK